MNGVLADLEKVEYTISRIKSQFCILGIRVIGFICDFLKRYSDLFKVIKIVKWISSNDITETRAFIKMMIYYKMFIKNFSLIAAPIYSLIKKRAKFI